MSQKTTSAGKEDHKIKAAGGRAGGGKGKNHPRPSQKNPANPMTEAELRDQANIRPEGVLRLTSATEGEREKESKRGREIGSSSCIRVCIALRVYVVKGRGQ